MGKKPLIKEQWMKIQIWKQHPEWTTNDAVKHLHAMRPTPLSWKKKYWNMEKLPPEAADRFRTPEGGRKYKLHDYEESVLVLRLMFARGWESIALRYYVIY
ncbi:hypothetical protein GN958_ATG05038 [Phytophthora infestans]|uniref:Uncharacterized protein n=1 Tax=Phytophthora infestans TaxID=4787 RepID=A0A8S9UYT9_PHYIN|nr:hypothetical protein GN958_ATG05038 [Phytophthora infestans]